MESAKLAYDHTVHILHEKIRPGTVEFNLVFVPVLAYWLVAGAYELLDAADPSWLRRYRIQRTGQGYSNRVTKLHVAIRVMWQHVIQVLLGLLIVVVDPDQCAAKHTSSWIVSAVHFACGMFVMDTWQYFIHRWAHLNTYLYKHVHSTHHRIYKPYAIAALYNHPVEALVLDTLGGAVSLYATGMSCEVAAAFFTFATIKTVLDHCGWLFPVNPLHDLFPNSAAYHDVHHDIRGTKKNFSQPFFTHWDWLLGTYLHPSHFQVTAGKPSADTSSAAAGADTAAPATAAAGRSNGHLETKKDS